MKQEMVIWAMATMDEQRWEEDVNIWREYQAKFTDGAIVRTDYGQQVWDAA